MEARRRRPTLADVARLSNVSTATVSYIVNAREGQTIAESTRLRVLASASELGYRPNATAQALARGRSRLVVIDQSALPAGTLLDAGMYELAGAFERRGYVPVIDRRAAASADHSVLVALCEAVVPTAVVTMGLLPPAVLDQLRAAGVDNVVALQPSGDGAASSVTGPTKAQMQYLITRGHRHIGYLPHPAPELSIFNTLRGRAARESADAAGVRLTVLEPSVDPGAIAARLSARDDEADPMTAIAAYNDEAAMAVLAGAHRSGLAVPDQLSVIGVDDIPFAALTYPALTSVAIRPHPYLMPDELADAILSGSMGDPEANEFDVELTVVERDTVATRA